MSDRVKSLAKDKEYLSTEEWAGLCVERDDEIERLQESRQELERENDVLRGIVAAAEIPCVYCGLDDISKCAHGFPGCPQADDLLCGQDTAWKALVEEQNKLRGLVGELEGELLEAGGYDD